MLAISVQYPAHALTKRSIWTVHWVIIDQSSSVREHRHELITKIVQEVVIEQISPKTRKITI